MKGIIISFKNGQIEGLPEGQRAFLVLTADGIFLALCGTGRLDALEAYLGTKPEGLTNGRNLAASRAGDTYYFRVGNETFQYCHGLATWRAEHSAEILFDQMNLLT